MCESVGCGLALMREGDSRKSKERTRTRIDELECTINVCVKERIPSRASFFFFRVWTMLYTGDYDVRAVTRGD